MANQSTKSNSLSIKVLSKPWSSIARDAGKDSESYQIFLYDFYFNLYDNLERIKQLQLFSIQDFSEDALENQWFLYKPKYKDFPKTLSLKTGEDILTFKGEEIPDKDTDKNAYEEALKHLDIFQTIENYKSGETIVSTKYTPGELWVRLHNFPFAYPLLYVSQCANNPSVWDEISESEVYKIAINMDYGIIYYNYNGKHRIVTFTIQMTYNKVPFKFSQVDNPELFDRLDKELTANETEVNAIEKCISVNIIGEYEFKDQKFIDFVFYNSAYYIFFTESTETNKFYATRAEPEISTFGMSNLTKDLTINVPVKKYETVDNIFAFIENPNWSVSVSDNTINIAYETKPFYNE